VRPPSTSLRRTLVTSTLAAIVALAGGCTRASDRTAEAAPTRANVVPAGPAPANPAPTSTQRPTLPKDDAAMSDSLTWKLTRSADKLHVSYQFENTSGHVVYVNDGVVSQLKSDLWRYAKTNAQLEPRADTIAIVIGTPRGDVPTAAPIPGFYVAVAAHQKFDGSRDIPMPFMKRNPATGQQTPLGEFANAVLELYSFDGEPSVWRELKTDMGPVKVPEAPRIKLLAAAAQPIPKA